MSAFINYLIEANLGLCLFLLLYVVFLKNETDFKMKRVFLLVMVVASVTLPLFHFNTANAIVPSLSKIVPATWLPEFVVGASGNSTAVSAILPFDIWFLLQAIYATGVLISLILFLVQLSSLIRILYKANPLKRERFIIIESAAYQFSFSFFQFIFIGQADKLSRKEKEQIIEHERVHAEQKHSFDILLLQVLGIFFWFNPLLKIYRKIFIQLHEFEADARAVENRDLNDYCTLLAKVALLSADIKIANHFSNSLTLKRIEMMRTLKSKIRSWKIAAIAFMLPAFFFVVACQDQVMSEITEIAKNSSHAVMVPEHIQSRYDQLKKENPGSNYILVELNTEAQQKLAELEKTYGLPKSMEVFTVNDESKKIESIRGEAQAGVVVKKLDNNKQSDQQSFAILEFNELTAQVSDATKQDDEIFTVVEESASPSGGMEGLGQFLGENMLYPEESRKAGKEGTVFVEFVVNTNGSLSDFKTLKGVEPSMDEEALRVVKLMPNWNPGKQRGKVVRQRFVLPIKFKLG